ncbi:hypothetical protein J3R82DRAFT_3160 [Butyriboletus roseoflavus]|nr:hypothetical protein J3R82DRAFT_3160 [Butyriboletus roseoflavus]
MNMMSWACTSPLSSSILRTLGTRLGLWAGSQVNEDRTSAGGVVEEVAEAHALSSWTPAEHDALFRAISVHSRWRPDLIAACVPTRTEWEVWMYLEVLEEGAGTLATQRGGDDVNMQDNSGDERRDVDMQVDGSSSDSRSHSGSDTDEDQNLDLCEPALEVSQTWIDVEERMASWIVREEYLASVKGVADADAEDVDDRPPKRKRGRPRGAGKGRTHNRIRRQTVSSEGFRSPVHRSPSPRPSSTSAREREALMGRLELSHLMVLDGVLREYEEAIKEKSKSREGSVVAATPIEHGDAEAPRVRGAEVLGLSPQITAPQGTSIVPSPSNAVIDPVLLALSYPAGCQPGRKPSKSTLTSCAPAHVPTQGPSSLPNASCQPTSSSQPGTNNTFTFPLRSAAPTNPNPTANDESDLSLFSPRSRRRIQKRLHMRRKRALLRENGAASEDAVHAGIDRLKPGKKGKKARSERNEPSLVSTSVSCSEAPSDVETQLPENVLKKGKAGLTLPYKLKAQFAELGIDAEYLRGQGMDFLNLSALGKLMGLCSSLEHGEEEADVSVIAKSIDAQLIRHLQAAMVMFVTDVLHRVIVWREREIRLKQRSQAWRHGDQITIAAVEHAVEAIGARHHSHKDYFKSLGVYHTEPSSAPAHASEELDPDAEAMGRSAEPPGLSSHRDVYTPLIHPPSAWRMGSLACLTRTYEGEATRRRRGTSAEIAEEELMSDETDEEALEAELEEEEKTDVRDMELGAREEEGLWHRLDNRVNGGSVRGENKEL